MADIITDWLCNEALPLWSENGWDPRAGMFVERLDLAGAPLLAAPRRSMVQARQIFVFCVAFEEGWWLPGADLARRAGENLVARFQADRRPGWAFAADHYGVIVDGRRDLYAQAFVLLAFASLARLDGDTRWLAHADATLEFLDRQMGTPAVGGYVECEPSQNAPRRQNPHMHLFEALLALHESDPARGYLSRAGRLLHLLEGRFLCGSPPVLVEYFGEDWSPLDGPLFSFEPGHHFEWAWLLDRYARLGGANRCNVSRNLWQSALTLGVGPMGSVHEEVRSDGSLVKSSTRLWSSAEAAKAATCGFDVSDCTWANAVGRGRLHEAFLETLHRDFLAPASKGSWIDHLDSSGVRLVDFAPASSLYHICGAVQEAKRYKARGGISPQ